MIPDYPVYLAVPLASQRLPELRNAAHTLELGAARVLGVDLFYRSDTDVLLLLIRLDARVASHAAVDRLREAAERAEAAVLETARLDADDRRSFFQDYLPRYPFQLSGFPSVTDAIRAFARDLGHGAEKTDPGLPPLGVRFRRGDEWQVGRLKSLSREGMHVVTGAPPRVADVIDIALHRGHETLSLRGEVVYVARAPTAVETGGSGYSARFLLRSSDERQALERLLLAEGVSKVRAAPSRREARYPVKWPLTLRLGQVSVQTAALDVSASGMFVSGEGIPGRQLELLFHLDDEQGPVHAGARIARRVDPQVAAARGISAGVGVELVRFDQEDGARFRGFVDRVGRRAHRAVAVAADGGRAQGLAAHLLASGYIAYAVSEPEELVRLVNESPPDMVLCSAIIRRYRTVRLALAARKVIAQPLEIDATPASVRGLVDAVLLS